MFGAWPGGGCCFCDRLFAKNGASSKDRLAFIHSATAGFPPPYPCVCSNLTSLPHQACPCPVTGPYAPLQKSHPFHFGKPTPCQAQCSELNGYIRNPSRKFITSRKVIEFPRKSPGIPTGNGILKTWPELAEQSRQDPYPPVLLAYIQTRWSERPSHSPGSHHSAEVSCEACSGWCVRSGLETEADKGCMSFFFHRTSTAHPDRLSIFHSFWAQETNWVLSKISILTLFLW